MTRTDAYDWAELMAQDLAGSFAAGAEAAITDATRDGRDLGSMTRTEHAQVGTVFALLSLRAQVAQTGQEIADQLADLAASNRETADAMAEAVAEMVGQTRRPAGLRRRLVGAAAKAAGLLRRRARIVPDEAVADDDGLDQHLGEHVGEHGPVPQSGDRRLSVVPGGAAGTADRR